MSKKYLWRNVFSIFCTSYYNFTVVELYMFTFPRMYNNKWTVLINVQQQMDSANKCKLEAKTCLVGMLGSAKNIHCECHSYFL